MSTWTRLTIAALASLTSLAARPPAAAPREVRAAPMYDCNDNGVEDAVDIAIGSSIDANRDGIPDECQSELAK
jgi:hypothetical protein